MSYREGDEPGAKGQAEALYEVNKALKNAPKPVELITEAPEGYYYRGEDVQEYNRQAIEYNRQLREYRSKLESAKNDAILGLYDYELYSASYKLYQAQLKAAKPSKEEMERERAYVESYGPPEPSEESRRRQAEGLPQVGLPGPAAGPKPGTLGERIGEFVGGVVARADVPFRVITETLRRKGEELEGQGLESAAKGEALVGFTQYAGSVVADTAAMAVDVATFELRPQLWAEVGRTIGGVVYDPDIREKAVEEVIKDPFRFTAVMVGGAYLGGVIRDFPENVRGLPSKVRRIRAEYDWAKYGDESLYTAGEAEIGMQFPEAEITYEPTGQLYRRAQLTIYDRVGLVKEKLPYYIEAEPEFLKTRDIFEAAEDWSPTMVKRGKGTVVGYGPLEGEGGFLKVEGAYGGMKPFKEPSLPSAPRSEAIQVLTTKGVESTPIKGSLFTQADRAFEYVDIEPITTYVRPVDLKQILTPETVRVTEPSFSLRDLGISASILKLSDVSVQRVSDIQRQSISQVESQLEKQLSKVTTKLESQFGLKQPVALTQIEVQLPKITQIQTPRLSMPQLQMPKLDEPQITMPKIPKIPTLTMPPREPPRKVVRGEREPKKKKKVKKRRKGVFELRVDFPNIKLPKEPRL